MRLIGRLGANIEVKVLESGDKVGTMTIAETYTRKKKGGDSQEVTQWHKAVVFGKYVDTIESMARKGNQVLVLGEYRTRLYLDKAGVEKLACEIKVESFRLLSEPNKSA